MQAVIIGLLVWASVLLCEAGAVVHPSDSLKRPVRSRNRQSADSLDARLQINRIFILGNRVTRESIILRELSVQSGDSIGSAQLAEVIEKDKKKLFNLALFNTVEIRALIVDNGLTDLLVEVDERWYTFPVPIFQLSDRNFNEWWETYNHDLSRVNYGLKLFQYNVRGRNETLALTAQFGFVHRYEFSYRIPYIDRKQKQGLTLEGGFIEAKNVAYQTLEHKLDFLETRQLLRDVRFAGITYTYRNSFYNQHRINYAFRYTKIADTIAVLNPNYLGNESRHTQEFDLFSYEFVSDHRDVIAYPLHGYQWLVHVKKTGAAIRNDIDRYDMWLSFSKFMEPARNWFLSNLSFAYWTSDNRVPYYNYGVMGYNRTLIRGYELNVIEGPWYVLNKTTLKKRIFSRTYRWDDMPLQQFRHIPFAIYLKTYFDLGYVENYPYYESRNLNTALSSNLLSGGGLGIDFVSSYDMVVRLECSLNSQGNTGLFFHIKKEF